MKQLLHGLKKHVTVGVVGGSDLVKIKEQLGEEAPSEFDYLFSENGLVSYRDGKSFHSQSFKDWLGEERLKKFLNFNLSYLSQLDIPIKRGTFIEFRKGMLNISPIGRNCSQEERDDFYKYDSEHKVREKMVSVLETEFADYGLKYSIGGQISFDVFPKGWDKTYCLQFVKNFDNIYFFGDKTLEGGNDFEIYNHDSTHGYSVIGPEHTAKILEAKFLSH